MKNILATFSSFTNTNVGTIILSVFFVIGVNHYFFENHVLGNESIINIFMMTGAYFILKGAKRIMEKKLLKQCIFFCAFLTTSLFVGRLLYFQGNLHGFLYPFSNLFFNIISIIGMSSVLSVLLSIGIQYIIRLEIKLDNATWKFSQHPWIFSAIIFLCWIPCHFAYYPGIVGYDLGEQTLQALGTTTITRYHPPLHTFFWQLCLYTENTLGINAFLCYAVVQRTLLSIAFGYVICFLIKCNINNWIVMFALLFFCLHPCIAVFSLIPVKDAMLAAFFVVYTVELCTFLTDSEKYIHSIPCNIRLIGSAILCCLLRNNMIYAILPATLMMTLFLRKYWKQLFMWFIFILLGYSLVNGPVYSALGVESGNVREMLSVPIQQITYVVVKHDIALQEEDKTEIDKFLPTDEIADLYNPRFADPVKTVFKTENFVNDYFSFFKIWFKLFLRYPSEYIESFLNLNLPYWYADACSYDSYSERKYIETHELEDFTFSGYEFNSDSKLPKLYSVYQALTNYITYMYIPIISNFFSISTPIWIILFGMLILKAKRKMVMILPILPSCFMWFTFLFGPVSNFRYMFSIIVLYPIYLAIIVQPSKFTHTH